MPNTALYRLKQNWLTAYDTSLKQVKLLIGSILITAIINIMPGFFRGIEDRNGIVLNDWVLTHLPAYDVSIPIFALIWGMGILMAVRAFYKPAVCTTYIWTLIFVCIARFISLTLVKLDPPTGLVPLVDPLTSYFYGHASITKDLFFSGHTSTMVLIYLHLERKRDKAIALIAALVVMALLLIQHIHYTMDVLAAPVIVYCCYRFARAFNL
ncbi:phosphatase PAP2 family protein [Mucilaginibacter sp. HC2]|uniref:phosphatase PAP2-related protein n=1 Tax=Mucilaginibacter inviolabilis TaxID=2714892 RepID=UPI00140A736B|nr:phosphatase PAP2-related protein [Mucilaginibacter inviolabilis]NHA04213.1 phosphatase PAP2 family protein [Mucilaginibacter inviolabilis]